MDLEVPTHPPTHPPTHTYLPTSDRVIRRRMNALMLPPTHPPTHHRWQTGGWRWRFSSLERRRDKTLITHPPTHPPTYLPTSGGRQKDGGGGALPWGGGDGCGQEPVFTSFLVEKSGLEGRCVVHQLLAGGWVGGWMSLYMRNLFSSFDLVAHLPTHPPTHRHRRCRQHSRWPARRGEGRSSTHLFLCFDRVDRGERRSLDLVSKWEGGGKVREQMHEMK